MKIIILFLSLACLGFSKSTFAQTAEEEAEVYYENAEKAYENKDYKSCEYALKKCIQRLGTTNSKIDYLRIRNLYDDVSDDTHLQDADEYNLLKSIIADFFQKVDKNNYPEEKYKAIIAIKLAAADKLVYEGAIIPVTREAALDTINKILIEYSAPSSLKLTTTTNATTQVHNYIVPAQIIADLKNCSLVFTLTFSVKDDSTDAHNAFYYTQIYNLNLVNLNFKNGGVFFSNTPDNISLLFNSIEKNTKGKIIAKSNDKATYFESFNPLSLLAKKRSEAFDENHTNEKFIKAIIFLMNYCGNNKTKSN
jgi:hypothetical protein